MCDAEGESGREREDRDERGLSDTNKGECVLSYASGRMSKRSMMISASWVLMGAKGPGVRDIGGGQGQREKDIYIYIYIYRERERGRGRESRDRVRDIGAGERGTEREGREMCRNRNIQR